VTFNRRDSDGFAQGREVASDIDDLIRYVRTHADTLNINKDRLCLWSASGGVPFAVRAALHDAPAFVRCSVAYYGPMDLLSYRRIVNPEATDETLREFSPISHLEKSLGKVAPLLIVKAAADTPAINESIDEFVQKATVQNVPVELVTYPTGHHAFDINNDDDRSREIIKQTLEFMKKYLDKQ